MHLEMHFPFIISWVKHEIIGTETDSSAVVYVAQTLQQFLREIRRQLEEKPHKVKLTKGVDGCRQGEKYYTVIQSKAPPS